MVLLTQDHSPHSDLSAFLLGPGLLRGGSRAYSAFWARKLRVIVTEKAGEQQRR